MVNEKNAVAEEEKNVVEEEILICKKCEKRLPNKSYFCMYCGTDNSPTSIQVEYEKANNASIGKYTIIKGAKKTIPWYAVFMFLIINVIVLNFILTTNHEDIFIKVNSANFKNYEKTYLLAEDAYLAVKDNKIRIIGSNRLDYIEAINDIQQYEFKDIQETYDMFGRKVIYFQTSKNTIYSLTGKNLEKIETENEYIDIYHYLNDQKFNCYNETEHTVLAEGNFYYDVDKKEIIQVGNSEYINNGVKVCKNYKRTTVIDNNELDLDNPELIYQSLEGNEIILRDSDELLVIKYGKIENRYKEMTVNEKKIKISDAKKIFYENKKFIIIDNKNDIYTNSSSSTTISNNTKIPSSKEIKLFMSLLDKDAKINLIILLVLLLGDIVLLYKMSNQHTFSKCLSFSGILMIEYILYTVFRGSGFRLNSGADFVPFLKLLALAYILIFIISTVIVQMSELVIKLLDLIKFRNIISYAFTLVAIMSIFINVLNSGTDGLFFAVFLLGSYWSYFTETEDVDINLFITTNTHIPIAVLTVANVVLYFALLYIFKISNYFVLLFLISIMFAIYLGVRPELAKKELTGKSIKSLIVMIMSLVYSFILTLMTMDLFNKLVKDDGTILKYVLSIGFKYILYLVVTFIFIIVISTILRILHKVIKTVCKNTNTVVVSLIFSLISLVLFTLIIFFLPEIINSINTGVNKIYVSVVR